MSKCVQIKEEYKRLTTLKDAFVLEFEKAVETGDLDNAKKLKAELEKAVSEFKEKLVYPGMIFNRLKSLAKKNN
ncbi:MAG: hypothetical protein L3J07_00005, partial [Candidatus Magasanikbacteria bacterium]|nr:hypothetical protein [Candidatus Magasanikbacteria bacterium]